MAHDRQTHAAFGHFLHCSIGRHIEVRSDNSTSASAEVGQGVEEGCVTLGFRFLRLCVVVNTHNHHDVVKAEYRCAPIYLDHEQLGGGRTLAVLEPLFAHCL